MQRIFHPVFRMKTGRKTLIKRKTHWKGGSGHGKRKRKRGTAGEKTNIMNKIKKK